MGNGLNVAEDVARQSFSDQDLGGQTEAGAKENTLDSIEKKSAVFAEDQFEGSSNGLRSRLTDERDSFLASFLADLIPSVKKQLFAIRNLASASSDRFEETEFRKTFDEAVGQKIKEIDSVLNSLLNYIHINTPVIKTNTLHLVLEEVLEANEKQIREKNIKIFKKSEKGLPETHIHDEQVRFILNSILQYAIFATPLNGSIAFVFRTVRSDGRPGNDEGTEGLFIEGIVGFTGLPRSSSSLERTASSQVQKEEVTDLILHLVSEILHRNHGLMKLEINREGTKSQIVLQFPVERRKVVYYERINI